MNNNSKIRPLQSYKVNQISDIITLCKQKKGGKNTIKTTSLLGYFNPQCGKSSRVGHDKSDMKNKRERSNLRLHEKSVDPARIPRNSQTFVAKMSH